MGLIGMAVITGIRFARFQSKGNYYFLAVFTLDKCWSETVFEEDILICR